jgi:hypothetical protein
VKVFVAGHSDSSGGYASGPLAIYLEKTSLAINTTYVMNVYCRVQPRGWVNQSFTTDLSISRWHNIGCAAEDHSPSWNGGASANMDAWIVIDGVIYNHTTTTAGTLISQYDEVKVGKKNTVNTWGGYAGFVGYIRGVRDHRWSTADPVARNQLLVNDMLYFYDGLNRQLPITTNFPFTNDTYEYGFGSTTADTGRFAGALFQDSVASTPTIVAAPTDPSPTCPTGYSGPQCDQPDRCSSSPCANGGTCSKRNNGWVCYCAAGWFGTTCSVS